MSKISIIRKIQLRVHSFPIENPDSEVSFSFYCGNGKLKHQVNLSLEKSDLLTSLIETGAISNTDLAQNDVEKLQNLEDENRVFQYRYQIYNAKECNNSYLIIFDITEYRDYYSCFIYAVLETKKINL